MADIVQIKYRANIKLYRRDAEYSCIVMMNLHYIQSVHVVQY